MALDKQCRDLLLGFEGYGPPDPTIIFMGQEERLGGDQPVEDEIRARCALISHHGVRGDKNVFGGDGAWLQPGKVNQWNYASQFVAAIAGLGCQSVPPVPVPQHEERWKDEYLRLGTGDGFTLLTERQPFPLSSGDLSSKKAFQSTYLAKAKWYSSLKELWTEVEPLRLKMLSRLASQPSVRWLVMYGAPYREKFLSIVGAVYGWKHFEVGDGTAMAARSKGRIVIITPFFGGRYSQFGPNDVPGLVRRIADELGPLEDC